MCGLHQKCSFAPIFVCSNMTAAHFHIGFLKETYKGRLGHSSPIPPCQFGGHHQQPEHHQNHQQPDYIVVMYQCKDITFVEHQGARSMVGSKAQPSYTFKKVI